MEGRGGASRWVSSECRWSPGAPHDAARPAGEGKSRDEGKARGCGGWGIPELMDRCSRRREERGRARSRDHSTHLREGHTCAQSAEKTKPNKPYSTLLSEANTSQWEKQTNKDVEKLNDSTNKFNSTEKALLPPHIHKKAQRWLY